MEKVRPSYSCANACGSAAWAATNEALKDPQVLKQLHVQGLDVLGGRPDEFGRLIKSETERWVDVLHKMPAAKR